MIIKSSQTAAFDSDQRQRFHREMLADFREHLPQQVSTLSDAQLLKLIETSHDNASGYGISTKLGITQFVTISVLAGVQFHEQKDVHQFLQMTGLTGDQRMQLLCNYLEQQASKSAPWQS